VNGYYVAILAISIANLVFAAATYVQRAKQVRGNALREHQVTLARTRNELAEIRLGRLEEQLDVLTQIRDALSREHPPLAATATDIRVNADRRAAS
jgi:hypothetical protein